MMYYTYFGMEDLYRCGGNDIIIRQVYIIKISKYESVSALRRMIYNFDMFVECLNTYILPDGIVKLQNCSFYEHSDITVIMNSSSMHIADNQFNICKRILM